MMAPPSLSILPNSTGYLLEFVLVVLSQKFVGQAASKLLCGFGASNQHSRMQCNETLTSALPSPLPPLPLPHNARTLPHTHAHAHTYTHTHTHTHTRTHAHSLTGSSCIESHEHTTCTTAWSAWWKVVEVEVLIYIMTSVAMKL
jgi:hypothetical protein